MSLTTNTTGRAAEAVIPTQEAVMGKAIPSQHPAVVLRSHYRHVRALLAIALIAVVGLTVAVVIVANDTDEVGGTSSAAPTEPLRYGGFNPATGRPESAPLPQRQAAPTESLRYGGFNPATGRPESAPLPQRQAASEDRPGLRYDGGPEEGTPDVRPPSPEPGSRPDGGPTHAG